MSALPKVLVVEDTGPSARLFAELVKLSGGDPMIAHTGSDALDVARDNHLALVIMDLRLPDGDGREWAKRIRDEVDADAVIWACSGMEASELIETAWDDMPFAAWIQKPFDVSVITQKLADVLQSS